MKNMMIACVAAAAAVCVVGCVPGKAEIKVKSSELAKIAKGEIGWADVAVVASNAYPNVTMDVFPERARNLKPPMTYAQPGYGEFSATNRLSDALEFIVEKLNGALPDFFCKDEKVELSCSAEGTNAVLVLRAKLKAPIGKMAVLENADLPRVLQFAIEDGDDKIVPPDVAAFRRYNAFLNVTQTALQMAGYEIPSGKNGDEGDGIPLDFETLLSSLTQIQYLDKIEVLQEMDIAAAPMLKSHNAETAGDLSCLWMEGEGFMGKFEREMRAKMMPADATDVVFKSDEHSGRSVTRMWATVRGNVGEASFRAFAKAQGYMLASNAMDNADVNARDENPHPDMMHLVIPSDSPKPENYLSYCCIHRNNGGMVLVYDKDRRILYGHYIHH
ncbi:MAG: hypothetical protein E7049_12050 [Lentisphaerae bacterium]|nr:hypothetical protein [Lentisphaerota bacterium]